MAKGKIKSQSIFVGVLIAMAGASASLAAVPLRMNADILGGVSSKSLIFSVADNGVDVDPTNEGIVRLNLLAKTHSALLWCRKNGQDKADGMIIEDFMNAQFNAVAPYLPYGDHDDHVKVYLGILGTVSNAFANEHSSSEFGSICSPRGLMSQMEATKSAIAQREKASNRGFNAVMEKMGNSALAYGLSVDDIEARNGVPAGAFVLFTEPGKLPEIGLRDVITELEGQRISSSRDLVRVLRSVPANSTVRGKLYRHGEERAFSFVVSGNH